jgi:Lanthionine synthetase C-like protein
VQPDARYRGTDQLVLYRPEVFEPLTDEAWDEARVRAALAAIVADADDAYDQQELWPANEWDAWEAATPLKDIYVGASGVVWALDALRRRGHAESTIDLAGAATRALERWRAEPDLIGGGIELPSRPESSLLCGESGLLLVAWRLAPSSELADALLARVRANVDNEADELMWGSPGTLLAAHAMHEWTGQDSWAQAWSESAEALGSRRDDDFLWTQRLYGQARRFLGPAHGLVGIVHALLQRPGERNESLERETAARLAEEAVVEDGLANWPALAGGELDTQDSQVRVQWCHGAPGIVTTAGQYLEEGLVLAGAELAWRAGPHGPEKGPGICHGTAGNGYALLKAFVRTGDERWLDRARRFAVHALGQVERMRAEQGRGRYSLFTGDVGVALFAASCLDADARYPILDGWD